MNARAIVIAAIVSVGGLVSCSSSTTQGSGPGGAAMDGGGGGGTPTTVSANDKEPNDDAARAQDLGSFAESTVVTVTGELSSGGNDGSRYTGDLDVFALTLGATGKLDVSATWEGGADVDVAVYDGSERELASEGTPAKPAAVSVASASGKVLVALFSKDQAAKYALTITYTKSGGGGGGGTCSPTPAEPAAPTGGCNITLSTAACSTADLTGGKTFELAWSTNTTFCEGPHKLQIGGDPPSSWSSGNAIEFSVSTQDPNDRAGMTRNIGGYFRINAADLQGLTSTSGVFYYRVLSFSGSASEIRAFNVVR